MIFGMVFGRSVGANRGRSGCACVRHVMYFPPSRLMKTPEMTQLKLSPTLRLSSPFRHSKRRGMVIIIVFVLMLVLSLAALTFFTLMQTENKAVHYQGSQIETQFVLDSGVEYLRILLEKNRSERDAVGGLTDNPALFKGVLIAEDLTVENELFGLEGTKSSTELGTDLSSSSAYTNSSTSNSSLTGTGTSGGTSTSNTGTSSTSGGSSASSGLSGGLSGSGLSGNSGNGLDNGDATSTYDATSTEPISGPLQGDSASESSTTSLDGSTTSSGSSKSLHRARVSILSPLNPMDAEDAGVRFGLENESGKLHLSAVLEWEKASSGAGRAALMQIPGMTETAADSILDWMDEDDEPRSFGAESEYYAGQAVPYSPRNGLPQNLEELLLVQGVTRELLYGADANFDFIVRDDETERVATLTELQDDAEGSTGTSTSGTSSSGNATSATSTSSADTSSTGLNASWGGDSSNATSNSGISGSGLSSTSGRSTSSNSTSSTTSDTELTVPWSRFLTVCSAEKNTSRAGNKRVWLNNTDLSTLQTQLSSIVSSETVEYILFYRINGPYQGNETSGDMPTTRPTPDTSATPSVTFTTVLDIIGTRCQIGTVQQTTTNADGTTSTTTLPLILSCPLTTPSDADVAILLDQTTVDESEVLYGKINIFDAPQEVLMAIPGMNESLLSQIQAATGNTLSSSSSELAASTTSNSLSATSSSSSLTDGSRTSDDQSLVPLAQGMDLVTLRRLLPYITAGGDVFRGQIVAFWDDDTSSMRAEFVLDATSNPARQVYWKDLTMFGMVFLKEELGGEPMIDGQTYTQEETYDNPFESTTSGSSTTLF